MSGFVTIDSTFTRPRFSRAWRDQQGFTHAVVYLSENGRDSLMFDDAATARETAAACMAAAEALEALPSAGKDSTDA